MDGLSTLETFAAFGLAGLGVGLGLMIGVAVTRLVRRFMKDDNGSW
jgi:hypothetical protein